MPEGIELELEGLSQVERSFLLQFARYKEENFGAVPPWAEIGRRIGVSRQWARMTADRLIGRGLIRQTRTGEYYLVGETRWKEPEWAEALAP